MTKKTIDVCKDELRPDLVIETRLTQYKITHQKVFYNIQSYEKNNVQILILIGLLLYFGISNFLRGEYIESVVNLIFIVIIPLIFILSLAITASHLVKIIILGKSLKDTEDSINKVLYNEARYYHLDDDQVLNWEYWRIKQGHAKKNNILSEITFSGLLLVLLLLTSTFSILIRLKYLFDKGKESSIVFLNIAIIMATIFALTTLYSAVYYKREREKAIMSICGNEKNNKEGKNKDVVKYRRFLIFMIIAILVIFMFVIFGINRFNFCSPKEIPWLSKVPIAHRGLYNESLDQNSIGAFENAIDNGYAIEFDLRFTKDGIPVVIHDNNLEESLGHKDKISNMTIWEVKELTLPKSNEKIPTLEETLELVNSRVPLLIEIKHYGIPNKFEKTVMDILKTYKGEYAIQCYNPFVCNAIKKYKPSVPVGLLLNDVTKLDWKLTRTIKDNLFTLICSPNFVTYNYELVDEGMLEIYRKSSVTVLGFVLHESDIDEKGYNDKIDNIIFELDNMNSESVGVVGQGN